MLSQTPESKYCELVVDVPKEIECTADRNLLKQVFYNLAKKCVSSYVRRRSLDDRRGIRAGVS